MKKFRGYVYITCYFIACCISIAAPPAKIPLAPKATIKTSLSIPKVAQTTDVYIYQQPPDGENYQVIQNGLTPTLTLISLDVQKPINITVVEGAVLDLTSIRETDLSNATLRVYTKTKPKFVDGQIYLNQGKSIQIQRFQYCLNDINYYDFIDEIPPNFTVLESGNFAPDPTAVSALITDTSAHATALASVVEQCRADVQSKTHLVRDTQFTGLQRWLQKNPNVPTSLKLEHILHAMSTDPPLILEKPEARVWVSPYFSSSSTKASDTTTNSKSSLFGCLLGAEYRSIINEFTIGLLFGLHQGQKDENSMKGSNTISANTLYSGSVYGLYHSKGLWKGGRYDLFLSHVANDLNRTTINSQQPNRPSTSDNKITSNIFDFQMSHLIKWSGHIWSFRFNIGHTFISYNTTKYIENFQSDPLHNMITLPSKGKSFELYGGVGVRWNHDGDIRIRITGVYELGVEYKRSGGDVSSAYVSTPMIISTIPSRNNKKELSHYITLNITSLSLKTGWKFYAGINSTIRPSSFDSTLTFKAEYRF